MGNQSLWQGEPLCPEMCHLGTTAVVQPCCLAGGLERRAGLLQTIPVLFWGLWMGGHGPVGREDVSVVPQLPGSMQADESAEFITKL